jgi:hypothetical protein
MRLYSLGQCPELNFGHRGKLIILLRFKSFCPTLACTIPRATINASINNLTKPSHPRPCTLNLIAAANECTYWRAAVLALVSYPSPKQLPPRLWMPLSKPPPTEPPIEPTTNPTIEDIGQAVKVTVAVVAAAATLVAAIAAAMGRPSFLLIIN